MTHAGTWQPPPRAVRLSGEEVHVWRASIDRPAGSVDALRELLSEDERAKAARFHFPRDRDRYIAGRGILRSLLGGYLDRAPRDLHFVCNAFGKPELAVSGSGHASSLRFNVSHSHGMALYAVTAANPIGIDIERIETSSQRYEQLAERFFAPGERHALGNVSEQDRPGAFFACWTRKEAYIKARGEGLSHPLDSFEVSVTPGQPAALVTTMDAPREAAEWRLVELAPGQEFAAALAVRSRQFQAGDQLRLWQWPHSAAG